MRGTARLATRRPAEVTSIGAGGAAAAIAALTGMETTAAAIVVGAVGVIPTVVTYLVDTFRKGTQAVALVSLTPSVAEAAENVLKGAAGTGDWKQQADALDRVAGAVSKWADLLAVQPPPPSSASEE